MGIGSLIGYSWSIPSSCSNLETMTSRLGNAWQSYVEKKKRKVEEQIIEYRLGGKWQQYVKELTREVKGWIIESQPNSSRFRKIYGLKKCP